jgi:hypothetical protein
LEGNKNNKTIFFANGQSHLTNSGYLIQNVIKLDEMLQACDEKILGKFEAVVLKTQIRN